MTKIGAIVQARMTSRRFPGKVLHEVAGKPMLQYLLDRLECCALVDQIVVATSVDESDNEIAEFCSSHEVVCHRGPLDDVAGRFKEVLDVCDFDGFIRVNGDSPLLDQGLIDKAAGIFLGGDYDIVTNVLERTYPRGQSVEVVRAETFRAGYQRMNEEEDLEHVTKFFYRNRGEYRIFNFASEKNYDGVHLAVDNSEDMSRFAATVELMTKPHWEYGLEEIVALHQAVGLVAS